MDLPGTPPGDADTLERHGIIERRRAPSGRGWSYLLTEQGQDLKAVCDAMGQ
jgi:DNA-binding HxlR family transcriptional regulator